MGAKKVYDFLKECGTFYIATVENGDQARVRPFGALAYYEDKVYIQTGKSKNCFKQMVAYPKVEICAMAKGGGWIRVAGTLVLDDRKQAIEYVLDENPSLKRMYNSEDGNCAVLYFKDATAVINAFGKEPETINF
ncbi:MAG: NimC/NimA family protein [Eubacteriaceae bacterium]|nr:NimC/NimA family protein [Eubacteriaceae bacterium]